MQGNRASQGMPASHSWSVHVTGVAQQIHDNEATVDIPTMDQRRDPRFTLLIRAAKLIGPTGEYMCILRDASVSGVRAQIFHPLPEGKHLTLELPNGDRHRVEVVWEHDGHVGLRFENRVEMARLIGNPGPYPKRPVRLSVQFPALISRLGKTTGIVIRNLSQHGARIECPEHLAIDQKLRLEAESLPVIQARVRWRKDTDYGLAFDQTFRYDELARLVAMLQQGDDGTDGPRFKGVHFM